MIVVPIVLIFLDDEPVQVDPDSVEFLDDEAGSDPDDGVGDGDAVGEQLLAPGECVRLLACVVVFTDVIFENTKFPPSNPAD